MGGMCLPCIGFDAIENETLLLIPVCGPCLGWTYGPKGLDCQPERQRNRQNRRIAGFLYDLCGCAQPDKLQPSFPIEFFPLGQGT